MADLVLFKNYNSFLAYDSTTGQAWCWEEMKMCDDPWAKSSWFYCVCMHNTYLVHTRQQPPLFLCVLLPAPSDLKGTEIHNSAQNHSSVWDGSQRCSRSPLKKSRRSITLKVKTNIHNDKFGIKDLLIFDALPRLSARLRAFLLSSRLPPVMINCATVHFHYWEIRLKRLHFMTSR